MPTTEVVRKLIVFSKNTLCAHFEIKKSGGEPKLSKTALHERILGSCRIDDHNCGGVIASNDKFVALSNNDRKKFQCADMEMQSGKTKLMNTV